MTTGHNPITLNRLNNIKNTLEASLNWLANEIKTPNTDFAVLKTMLQDAVMLVEQLNPTKPEKVYRSPSNNLGPSCPRDQ